MHELPGAKASGGASPAGLDPEKDQEGMSTTTTGSSTCTPGRQVEAAGEDAFTEAAREDASTEAAREDELQASVCSLEPECDNIVSASPDTYSVLQSPRDSAQVPGLVASAFGPMVAASLSSAKWDRRVEALKGVQAMVKSRRLGEGTDDSHVPVATRILEQALCDKVRPVLLAALALHTELLGDLPGHAREVYTHVIAPRLVEHVGDSNARLHDAVVTALEQLTDAAVFAALVADVRPGKKVREGRLLGLLDAVGRLVRSQGSDDAVLLKPLVQLAVDHSKENVWIAAVDVLMELYEAGTPLEVRMKPTVLEVYNQRVAEIEEGGDLGEVMAEADFMIVGTRAPVVQEEAADFNMFADEDEALMDTILDDTGAAFNHTGASSLAAAFGRSAEIPLSNEAALAFPKGEVDELGIGALEDEFLRELEADLAGL